MSALIDIVNKKLIILSILDVHFLVSIKLQNKIYFFVI